MNILYQLKSKWSLVGLIGISACLLTVSSCQEDLPEAGSIEDLTPPQAAFSYAQLSPDNYLEVTFSNTSISATDHLWDFGDDATSTDLEPVHVYAAEGFYTVTLTSNDKLGVKSTTTMEIELKEPDAFIPPILEASFEDGQLEDGAGDGRDSWRNEDLGGIIQITSDPVYDGSQAAKLPGDAGDARIGYQLLTVTANTVYDLSFFYTMKNDKPGFLTVSVLDGPVTSHEEALAATIGSKTVSDQSNPDVFLEETVSFNSAENSEVAIYFFNDGSVETRLDKFSIDIGEEGTIPPSASFSYQADAANYLQIDFSNNSINANGYSWDFGDGGTATEEDPSHTYSAAGDYTVILTARNSLGLSDETSMQVSLVEPISAVINNPSFDDEAERDDNRTAWRNEALEADADVVIGDSDYMLQTSSTARTGSVAAKLPTLENSSKPRRWLYQAIKVEANTDYKISGWIRNKDAGVGSTVTFSIYDAPFDNASNIGNSGSIINSEDFDASTGHDTNDWVEATISFNSGSSTEIVLFIENDSSLNGDPDTQESETFLDDFSISEG